MKKSEIHSVSASSEEASLFCRRVKNFCCFGRKTQMWDHLRFFTLDEKYSDRKNKNAAEKKFLPQQAACLVESLFRLSSRFFRLYARMWNTSFMSISIVSSCS